MPAIDTTAAGAEVGASRVMRRDSGRARPKSITLIWPDAVIMMLAGLRSWCTIPLP